MNTSSLQARKKSLSVLKMEVVSSIDSPPRSVVPLVICNKVGLVPKTVLKVCWQSAKLRGPWYEVTDLEEGVRKRDILGDVNEL